MKTLVIGKNCIELQEIDSTNKYLAGLKDVFEGTVVLAKDQRSGRGQRGTNWESEPYKNLTISILLQPTFLALSEQFQLNKVVSLGVLDLTRKLPGKMKAGDPKIKWPNDIYLGSKKVAGILIENTVSGNNLQQSIVGIGLNVNQEKFSAALPNPTSLKLETGKEFDLKECLEELCSCMEKRYLQLRNGSAQIDEDYLSNLYRLNEWANYKFNDETLKAKITGVSKAGKLILQKEDSSALECDLKEVEFCK